MFAPGVRVARGPDWIWQNQDGGEGHVGTVCEIGRFGSRHSPEKTVVVNWDSGHRTNYRVGYQDQYDLVVVDNAQIGVKHPNVVCNGCSKAGIAGIRFRCAQCTNYDLCATCYGADVHDLDHSFVRYQTTSSVGVRVPTRQSSTKIPLRGIFVGAKVCRGPDWEWGQQDGGDGHTGRVMEIRGWDNESCRSVANVSWVSGSTNVYRLGHKGNVDLKYLQAAVSGAYYRDHMPVLGQTEEQQPAAVAFAASSSGRPWFAIGDIVRVCLEREALMQLQQGHGGWNPRMAEYLTKVGTVHRITDKGDIRVQYEGCANRWTFHPAALVKVCTFHVGDLVQIVADAAKVQQLQRGHGEWVDTMLQALGKQGKVIKVYGDGDLRIQQCDDGLAWTLNPKCVRLERSMLATGTGFGGAAGAGGATAGAGAAAAPASAERSNSMMDLSHQRADPVMLAPLSGLSGTSAADKLVREAAQGRIEYVQQHLVAHPADVDAMSAGKTCLQVAAHQGHIALVRLLLQHHANVNVVDKEGDSTLHYAAFGNQPDIMRVLLQHGADINVLNASHCSALHISAHKRPPHCVRVLLEHGADVNAQDSYGDTALHDAIGKDNGEVVELLCATPTLALTVRNNRGFNALHHAALKGNVAAARQILGAARHLVDGRKDDGFAALHLAALNGHAGMVEVLVRTGEADIDVRNNRQQTPFLLAVSQGHAAAIERLVQLGCDVRARDEDGDNAMHLCVIKKSNLVQEVPRAEAPQIWEIYRGLDEQIVENRLMCAILCYLLRSGCRIEANNKGKNILDWVWDKAAQELILSYVRRGGAGAGGAGDADGTAAAAAATVDAGGSGGGSGGGAADQQIYSNIFAMTMSDTANNGAAMPMADAPASSASSNPPTPMRRAHLPGSSNDARNLITPSPSTRPFIQYTPGNSIGSGGGGGGDDANNSVPSTSSQSPPHVAAASAAAGPSRTPPPLPPLPLTANHASSSSSSNSNANASGANNLASFGERHPDHMLNALENALGALSLPPPPLQQQSMLTLLQEYSNDHHPHQQQHHHHHQQQQQQQHLSRKETNQTPAGAAVKILNSQQPDSAAAAADAECIVCNETLPLARFEPCGHRISCADCAVRMKKCLHCGVPIERRAATVASSAATGGAGPSTSAAAGTSGGPATIAATAASAAPMSAAMALQQQQLAQLQQQHQQQQQRQPSADRLRYLESKIQEIEETHCCSICMERRRNVAFLCGHGACSKCAETLKTCHMCRKSIAKKINLY